MRSIKLRLVHFKYICSLPYKRKTIKYNNSKFVARKLKPSSNISNSRFLRRVVGNFLFAANIFISSNDNGTDYTRDRIFDCEKNQLTSELRGECSVL